MARKGNVFGFVSSSALLLVIAVMCVIFFYTCSLKPSSQPESETETEIETPEDTPVELPAETFVEIPVEPGPLAVEPAEQAPIEVEPPETEEIQEVIQIPEEIPEAVSDGALAETESSVEDLSVPEAPDLDWFVYTELYVNDADNWDSSFFYQDVDWSQFVFSDEEVVLPDGTYYARLFVNDTAYGNVVFIQEDGVPRFQRSDLASELNGTLEPGFYEEFFANQDQYYTIEFLKSLAEGVEYDSGDLVLRLSFNSSQVPVQTLSMSSSSYSMLRQNYDVVGNVVLEPAHFSFQSNISAFLNAQYAIDGGVFKFSNLSASINLSNTFSFWNMSFSLPISLSYSFGSKVIPTMGRWSGYLDFPDDNLRLSFGHVGKGGFTSGSSYGLTLERNYGFGTGSALSNQYEQTITLMEDSFVDIKVNGNSVYSRRLNLGIYRLTDFAFIQGNNDVVVTIHPLSMGDDTSNDQTINFNQDYDTSLLAKGESTWKFGLSIPEVLQQKGGGGTNQFDFVVPAMPVFDSSSGKITQMENVFNLSALSVFWEQSVGLSHIYTQSQSFSFVFERNQGSVQDPGGYSANFSGTVSGVLATSIGTSRATLSGSLSSSNVARNSLSLSLSQTFVDPRLKPLNLSGSYSISYGVQTLSLNTGYSFALKSMRVGLSLSSAYRFSNSSLMDSSGGKPWTVNGSLSLGTNLGKNISLSVNASVNQDLNVYATASMSMSFGRQSVNTSITSSNLTSLIGNAGWYYRPSASSRDSFQINLSNLNFLKLLDGGFKDHSLSATWSRSGELMNMSLRQQASNSYQKYNTSFSLNTALGFADGYFAMTNNLYSPFVIVAPQGGLKSATVSVSNAVDSSNSAARKTFGNILYTRLTMYRSNNIVVYASSGSLFTSAGSFLFKVTPKARQGFLAKISLDSSVAVSGILRQSERQVYDSYSSPIYKVHVDNDGQSVTSIEIDSSAYFFTDFDGRYILSNLAPGVYMFDLNVGGQWYAAFFEVPVVDKAGYVALFKDFDASTIDTQAETMQKYNIKTFDASYAGSVYIGLQDFVSEQDYWDMLFELSDVDDENTDSLEDDFWVYDAEDDGVVYEQVTNTAL